MLKLEDVKKYKCITLNDTEEDVALVFNHLYLDSSRQCYISGDLDDSPHLDKIFSFFLKWDLLNSQRVLDTSNVMKLKISHTLQIPFFENFYKRRGRTQFYTVFPPDTSSLVVDMVCRLDNMGRVETKEEDTNEKRDILLVDKKLLSFYSSFNGKSKHTILNFIIYHNLISSKLRYLARDGEDENTFFSFSPCKQYRRIDSRSNSFYTCEFEFSDNFDNFYCE